MSAPGPQLSTRSKSSYSLAKSAERDAPSGGASVSKHRVLDQYGTDPISSKLSESVSYFDVIAGGDTKDASASAAQTNADSSATSCAAAERGDGSASLYSDGHRCISSSSSGLLHLSSNALQRQHFSEWLEAETVVDVSKLRAAAMQYGVPGELRAEVWKYLLGTSKPERSGELSENKKRAALYEERLRGVDENDDAARRARAEARRRMQQRRFRSASSELSLGIVSGNERRGESPRAYEAGSYVWDHAHGGGGGGGGGGEGEGEGEGNWMIAIDSSGASSSSTSVRGRSSRGAGGSSSSSSVAGHDDEVVVGIRDSESVGANIQSGGTVGGLGAGGVVRSVREADALVLLDAATAELRERIIGRVIAASLSALGGGFEYNADLVSLLMPFVEVMHTEHDVFYCYLILLQKEEEIFRDQSSVLKHRVASFLTMFRVLQGELWEHFESEEINAAQWVPSWLRGLLARQLPPECVLRLWDAYFASREGLELHPFVCLAVIDLVQEELLELDGGEVLSFLHALPSFDMDHIITHAQNIREDVIGRGIL
mmetsp:Transcript_11520/g.31076  ORF Transcript_11520/g.31076 Transcript_11520/m.31076 type:complete len:545 (+) Transcript_11520:97-1731(+)